MLASSRSNRLESFIKLIKTIAFLQPSMIKCTQKVGLLFSLTSGHTVTNAVKYNSCRILFEVKVSTLQEQWVRVLFSSN